jgi:hypothetical protein
MSWRKVLGDAVDRPIPEAATSINSTQSSNDNIDTIDRKTSASNSVDSVDIIYGEKNPLSLPEDSGPAINPLPPKAVDSVKAWPTETQRVFVACLDHFKGQGYALWQAESLAYATVDDLMKRHRSLVALLEKSMPPELE